MSELKITVAGVADLTMIAQWAADEGWNPGNDDRLAFAAADPHGFLIGRLDGEPVSCLSVVRYPDGAAFLGHYIVRPRFRGRGYGLRTWQNGMARMAGRNVGLDGVVDQQANYRKSGFVPAWDNIRYEGTPPGEAAPPSGVALTDALSLPADLLHAYDRRFFPAPRPAFLACWLALPGRAALAATRDGELVGLGVVRPARDTPRIGPLYAETPSIAAVLISRLAGGVPVVIDVPEMNPRAVEVAEELGLKPSFPTARMYTGPAPEIDRAGLYGITSLELG